MHYGIGIQYINHMINSMQMCVHVIRLIVLFVSWIEESDLIEQFQIQTIKSQSIP